jgi:hypothetical protein
MQVGLSEAAVLLRKIHSFGDPRLYALTGATEHLARSAQPLVPERVFVAGANGESTQLGHGMFGVLLNLLVAEKSGFQLVDTEETTALKEFANRMANEAMESVGHLHPQVDADRQKGNVTTKSLKT